jgi:hypothetical protein
VAHFAGRLYFAEIFQHGAVRKSMKRLADHGTGVAGRREDWPWAQKANSYHLLLFPQVYFCLKVT